MAHRRVGLHGRPFWMWKLRTMWEKGDGPGGAGLVEYLRDPFVPADKTMPDPRVTHPFGRWLRRYSLDELPQLFHVVRGEMAIVGPRPLTQEELTNYYGADAAEVLTVKPGITGLWQVSGRNQLTYAQRLQFDLRFVRADSSLLYWSVLLRTIPALLKRGGCH